MNWCFHDDGPHGGAWYHALGTGSDTPVPVDRTVRTPFGDLAYSHQGPSGLSWFRDGEGAFWGVQAGDGGGFPGPCGYDPLEGLLLTSEAWLENLAGLNARFGYDPPRGDREGDAYRLALSCRLHEYSPLLRTGVDRPRSSHLED